MYFKLNYGEVDFEVLRTQWGAERKVLQNFFTDDINAVSLNVILSYL
jgi:hypothetical protein